MTEDEKKRKFNTIGVYLTDDEILFLDHAADELHVSRHAILQLAVRHFIDQYKAGDATIETTEKTVIKKETGQ